MLDRFEKFICDITEIDLYWHRIASVEMKRFGLKGSYAIYFPMLKNSPEGMSAAELASMCGRDKADVSRDISALEKAELLRRIKSGGTAYRAKIVLTDKGRELTEEIIKKAELAVNCVGSMFTNEERDCFYRVLDEITRNLQTLSETGLPDGVKEQ